VFRPQPTARRGVAAVELAAVLLFLLVPLIIGVWEVGRLVHVRQVVSNSAREGARLASQGYTINTSGAPTQIRVNSGTPNVQEAVYQYLVGSGLTGLRPTDVTVQFEFLAPKSDGTTPTEPFEGEKNQPFRVTVSIPWNRVRWVNLGMVNPTRVTYTVVWQMMIDERFTVNDSIPNW
jgi:Flp pilus assembly protein TadG